MSAVQPIVRITNRIKKDLADERGVVLMVLVVALLVVAGAFIVTKLAMNAGNTLERTKGTAAAIEQLNDGVLAYVQSNAGGELPCPDASVPPDGIADEDGSGNCVRNSGVFPWSTLGVSPASATDAYGAYFTYVVSPQGRPVCHSITNGYNSALTEYTGTLVDIDDTDARLSSQGSGSTFYYAFVSHGENRLGAVLRAGNLTSIPSSAAEIENCSGSQTTCGDSNALHIVTGPPSTDAATYFDDQVFLGPTSDLEAMCERLTPGGKINAFVNESFSAAQAGGLPATLADAGTGTEVVALAQGSTTDYVLRFSGNNAAVTTPFVNFNPAMRALNISFDWRPIALTGDNRAGISVGLRATATDLSASDDIFSAGLDDGLTIRFFRDVTMNADGMKPNRIYICDDVTATCDTGGADLLAESTRTFTITDHTYSIEIFDDGVKLWARIADQDDATNYAEVFLNAIPATGSITSAARQDINHDNSILFINYMNATTELDDLLIGRTQMAANFDGINDIAATPADAHDTATGDLTLEAWIRPHTSMLGSQAVLMSKWTQGAAASGQAYRLYVNEDGDLAVDLAGDDADGNPVADTPPALGIRPSLNTWSHVAVVYDKSARTVSSFLNGKRVSVRSRNVFDANGVNVNGTARFAVGAELNNASAVVNPFDGDIADVRVWETARTTTEISSFYRARLPLISGAADATGLVANWTFDIDSGAQFGASAVMFNPASHAGVDGAFAGGAHYVATFQRYLMPFSDTFCPDSTLITAYQCDFRLTTQNGVIEIPDNLDAIHVKTWGAGGGGFGFYSLSSGGGGGNSQGRLRRISSIRIPGADLSVAVGAGGGQAPFNSSGAGGGGASGVWIDSASDFAGIIGGGGGGASFGDDNMVYPPTLVINCAIAGNCGPGGGGGGPYAYTSHSLDQTQQAADDGTGACGGRGGDNAPTGAGSPPTTLPAIDACSAGGADPVFNAGGNGTSGGAGGVSPVGSGGTGYTVANPFIGGGGGGGGVNIIDFSAGGGEAGGYHIGLYIDVTGGSGFGGGGGSGFVDVTVGNAEGVIGGAGSVGSAGNEFDPDYAGNSDSDFNGDLTGESYCDGTACVSNPGRGGEVPDLDGRPGAVILKW